jgi:uncharacterized protein (TIGR02246 family)
MKITRMWYLLGLLSIGGFAGSQSLQQTAPVEKAIAALENQWLQSQKTNNPDLVAPLLAEKFVYTSSDGKMSGKAAMLAEAKSTKWTSVENEDVQIRIFGDTAIATGVFKGKGTDSSGKPIDDHSRWTDTWVKMPDGKWQCVASHNSAIRM